MTAYNISVDLKPIVGALDRAGLQAYRAVNLAVRLTAAELTQQWQEQVYRLAPPYCRQEAVDSIKNEAAGPFSSVVSSDSQAVRHIEEGTPQRDLKAMLATSSKTKVSAKGLRYLTIPFRHGTPTATVLSSMPKAIHQQAQQLEASTVRSRYLDINAHGGITMRNSYAWGGHLPAGLAPKLKPSHKTDPYSGMARFDTSAPGKRSSAYLTFRVMQENSSGWIVPATSGMHVLRDLAAQGQRTLEGRISDVLRSIGA